MIINPYTFGVVGGPPVLTYQNYFQLLTSNSTSINVGTASASRKLIVTGYCNLGGSGSVGAFTFRVNGTIISPTYSFTGSSAGLFNVVYVADIPTGTTASIAIAYAFAGNFMFAEYYTVTNLNSSALFGSASKSKDTNSTVILDVPANGFCIGFRNEGYDGGSNIAGHGASLTTWTGLTKDIDTYYNSSRFANSSASKDFATAQAGLSVKQVSGAGAILTAVSFGNG
jgi:hypothetical protein